MARSGKVERAEGLRKRRDDADGVGGRGIAQMYVHFIAEQKSKKRMFVYLFYMFVMHASLLFGTP